MAVYVFKCRSCGVISTLSLLMSQFKETIQSTKVAKCPECGKIADLIPTSAGVHFKGTGWYVTDYKDSGKPKKKDST